MFHDSRDTRYRAPVGAAACSSDVRLFLEGDASSAILRLWIDNKEYRRDMNRCEGGFEYTLRLPDRPCVVWYYFIVGSVFYGNAPDSLGGKGMEYACEPPSYQITCYDPSFTTPGWLSDGVMMQILPDRFFCHGEPRVRGRLHEDWYEPPCQDLATNGDNTADDFYGGNLRGIADKLDYLSDLGVTVLYLNPIFMSPSNHKYNTADYMKIDPSFGTRADLRHLCAAAKKKGIRVILDGVFSHTGDDSLYFNKKTSFPGKGAYNSQKSKYYSWYRFREWPDDYDCWWGFDTLPEVNENDVSFRQFIYENEDSVCATYTRAGVSGWRLDVADELPMDFISGFRARLKREDPDAALIGEVWEDPSRKIAYDELRSYCLGDTLDSVMNYPLRSALFDYLLYRTDASDCRRQILSLLENTPECFHSSLMNMLGSHDKPRAISVLANCGNMEPERKYRYPLKLTDEQYALGKKRLIAAWRTVCALPGMPCIYYGDEAGMTGMADPFCRAAYPWGREDVSLQDEFRKSIRFRRENAALRHGSTEISYSGAHILIITRSLDDKKLTLAVNRSDSPLLYCDRELPPISAVWIEG